MDCSSGISNRLGETRRLRRISAAELALAVGVTRQTIHAIEAGTYVPNTAVALRLARVLDIPVEELFRLEEDSAPRPIAVEPLTGDLDVGQPVTLCAVGRATVAVPVSPVPAYLPVADAIFAPGRKAAPLRKGPVPERILIAGCDPALSILSAHARAAGVDVALASCNSSRALELLKLGRVHVAGTHLPGDSALLRAFPRGKARVVTFAAWRQGFVVAPGNPKQIRSASDLARRGLEIVNRETGAGSRILLDRELAKAGIEPARVRGYGVTAPGHLATAWRVAAGFADCCVATEAAARAFGLGFVPLETERFDLVVPKGAAESPPLQRLFDTMQRSALRRELELLGGYDTADTGRALA